MAGSPVYVMLNGLMVSSCSRFMESWNCIIEGRVTGTCARYSSPLDQSPLLETGRYGCEWGYGG